MMLRLAASRIGCVIKTTHSGAKRVHKRRKCRVAPFDTLSRMSLRADVGEVAGRLVVSLTGSVDLATVPTLQNAIGRVLVEHPGAQIAVDLDGVDSVDDVGLGILLGAAGRARANNGDIVIVCSVAPLRVRFALTGFDRAITITSSLTE